MAKKPSNKQVTFRIDPEELQHVDEYAKAAGMGRSAAFRDLAKKGLVGDLAPQLARQKVFEACVLADRENLPVHMSRLRDLVPDLEALAEAIHALELDRVIFTRPPGAGDGADAKAAISVAGQTRCYVELRG